MATQNRRSTAQKKKIFIQAFRKSHGIIQVGLDAAEIARPTYLNWMIKDKKFAEKVNSAGDEAVEFVETKLYQNIHEGKERSIVFYLKSRSEKYKEKTEQTINVNEPVKINIIKPE